MRIAVVFRADYHEGTPVPAYPWSYVEAFREMGHEVETLHGDMCWPTQWPDLLLEIENGRDESGALRFQFHERQRIHRYTRSAVLLYDTHGYPDLHAEIAKSYDHVFFGSWCKRDLFAGHPSAHWCPSATDLKWFGTPAQVATEPTFDVGFFGSKRGLDRAKDLVAICKANGWTYDVRQVASNRNVNRWPATGNAMARCRVLFNRGQKHDGPNLRVMESMAMGRPLVSDWDERDGMHRLFNAGRHFIAYKTDGLENALKLALWPENGREVAEFGRREVEAKYLIKHRAAQILEVVLA